MPIPHSALFFWGQNTALPYTRFLTMATFRLHHPDWSMALYQCRCADKDHWGCGIFVDFQFNGEELEKLYRELETEGVKVEQNLRDVAYDVLLHSKEPAPWDSIRYDQAAIKAALKTCATPETLTAELSKVVEKRLAREARRPQKHNYIQEAVERLGVELREYAPADKRVYTMPPPNVSDIFSVEILGQQGGWYLDLDQVVLRPLGGLSNYYDFICGGQTVFYIGIFGSKQGGAVVGDFYGKMLGSYDPKFYNSSGISAIVHSSLEDNAWLAWFKDPRNGTNHILEQNHFYPLLAPDGSNRFWSGNFDICGNDAAGSECVHYYGGNPVSQKFFREMTPDNILSYEGGANCMSKYIAKVSNGGQSNKKIFCFE
jgi:hypothetical protein